MLALGARVLADGVGFGRLVGGWMSRVHRYGRRCRGAWQTGCEPVLSCNGKNGNGEEHHRAVHEPPLRLYLAWSAGMDGCVMATSVGAAANAKGWIAPADSGVMIEDGVGPRRAVHEPPLRLYFGMVRRNGWMRYENIGRSSGDCEGMDRACGLRSDD